MGASGAVTLIVYGVIHFLVDATCSGMVVSIGNPYRGGSWELWSAAALYDGLAFGAQVFFGLAVDHWRWPRTAAAAGCVVTALAIPLLGVSTGLAICAAGLGNALFHVGGGSISLNVTPGRATGPGVFVGPGALGLAVGTSLGRYGLFWGWPFVVLLLGASVVVYALAHPVISYDRSGVRLRGNHSRATWAAVLVLLLFTISVRALIGMAVPMPWKSDVALLTILTLAIVAGKAFGGMLADRFGWFRVAAACLILSTPLVSFGAGMPGLAIPGMFLFQVTMPVTLAAVALLLPGRPAFAFGVASFALVAGAAPVFTVFRPVFGMPILSFAISLASAGTLIAGLRLLPRLTGARGGGYAEE
jgi:FSR family fosmidomycin resistance protein-like MFS transporter